MMKQANTSDDLKAGDWSADYHRGFVWSVCLVAALGGLLFGYDWIVISGTDIFWEVYFQLTSSAEIGWAKSCALLGCLLGAVVSGGLSDRFGRKRLLLCAALLFTVSSVGTALADHFGVFVLWRIVGGMAIGLASNLSPMYIAELAPASIRGRLVAVNQLTIVIGILLAQVANWSIAEPMSADATSEMILASWNGQVGWRWMFGVTAAPSLLFLFGMLFVPESPRWLVKRGEADRAARVLGRVGGPAYAAAALADIQATLVNEVGRVNFRDLVEPRMRKILGLGIILAVLQQWCGSNIFFYYTKDVFRDAGIPISDILASIVVIGLTNLAFTFVAIATVDRWGRRALMLAGWIGLAAMYVLMGGAYALAFKGLPVVVLVVALIACYACTLAPVTWVVLSEIFPNRIRGAAMSIAVFALWAGNFVLTFAFKPLQDHLGNARTFWMFAIICLAGYLFVRVFLPETKGRTLEEIERELVG